jgi:predicted permease
MGISLLAGRDFSSSDDRSGRPVIIVNETMAHGLWPATDPLGRFVVIDAIEREVVGVVRGTHHQALDREPGAEMYLPLRQSSPLIISQVYLIARGGRSPADLVAAVHDALRPMDSRVALNEVQVLQALVDKSLSPRRFLMLLVTGFAGFALVLASLGIYGVISYSMSQRRQEIGIRMALGASAGGLVRDVVTETLKLALIGIVPGLVLSWLLGQSLRSLLFGVTAWDPLTFTGIPLVLIAVAMLAGYLPARRASRLDPVQALRAD